MTKRHAHTVASDDAAVSVITVDASGPAGGEDHRLRAHLQQRTLHHVKGHHTVRDAIIYQQVEDKMLIQTLDLRVFQ
ncbi:hypothetical protein D3C71_2145660 [compost metagenome]